MILGRWNTKILCNNTNTLNKCKSFKSWYNLNEVQGNTTSQPVVPTPGGIPILLTGMVTVVPVQVLSPILPHKMVF